MTFFDLCASRWAWYAASYKLQPREEITWPMVKKCLASGDDVITSCTCSQSRWRAVHLGAADASAS
uniref:Uncharacterized protein n=1 Tax=Macrostomum lignano TaxID=282301 RepID=A0A1I8JPZ1_9PLAT